ncbi:hypothetical protein F511_19032 [Dorcoceras hygrometricum]|uniref:Uncharacterized protein n=1 Tax=Dorcoceras hygrometricum TaxID=472368 RepID=A0A2Z7BDY8_9LAMI|nr:hypothetical protein F511_19032 [Dorcoceras hygrometricum]
MTSSQSAVSYSDQQLRKSYQQMRREAQEMKRRRRRRFQSQVTVEEAVVSYYSRSCRQLPLILLLTNLLAVAILITVNESLMSNVEQEADNNKRNSEESDVVLKNQQMVRVQQMATVEWIQQKRKDKDSADGFALRTSSRGKSSRKHLKPTTGQPDASNNTSSLDKETAVARSVVTKNEQQLSEQLLNNLLENIQPFDAINAQDGKNQWLK